MRHAAITDCCHLKRRNRLLGGASVIGLMLIIGCLSHVQAAANAALPQVSVGQPPAAFPAPSSPTADPVASASSVTTAIGLLMEKAQFWYEHGRPEVALDFFNRVLSLRPDSTDALVGASKVSLDLGHEAQARDYVEKLRKIAPDDPFVVGFDTASRRSPAEAATLAEARHDVVLGRKSDALAKYRSLFKENKVPDELAAEYYPLYISTLSSDSVEADDALTALKTLADDNPKNLSLQLATGQAEVDLEGSRAEGIDRLHKLSKIPSVATRAKAIWRQALLWQGADFISRDQLEQYLAENPTDPELEAKRAEYRAQLPSEALRNRMIGYESITAGKWADAEGNFRDALKADKTDADAMIMLAVALLKEGRVAEAQSYVDAAIKQAPDRKQELLATVGEDPATNAKAAAEASAVVAGQYKQVADLENAGKLDEAIALLRSLIGNRTNAGSTLELSELQTRAGHIDDAMASLRSVLAVQPDNADANLSLAGLLDRQGHHDEAKALLARAEASLEKSGNEKGLQTLHAAQAEQMRAAAVKLPAPAAREAALRSALAVNPSDWWIRLDLARAVEAEGRNGEAQQMMDEAARAAGAPGAVDTRSGQDALQVAFVWAQIHNDEVREQALIALAPPDKRSASMQALLAADAFRQQVHKAEGHPSALLALAANPDPTGTRGLEVAHAFLRGRDVANLRRALELGLQATPSPSIQQRLAYASVLTEANQVQGAQSVLAGIDPARVSPEQRAAMGRLFDGMLSARVGVLLKQKRIDEAQRLVQQRIAEDPRDQSIQVLLARVQTARGVPNTALETVLPMIEKDPANKAARNAAIEAAVAASRLALADDLASDGAAQDPTDPFMAMQVANVARMRGMNGRALDYMIKAKALRNNQLSPADTAAQAE